MMNALSKLNGLALATLISATVGLSSVGPVWANDNQSVTENDGRARIDASGKLRMLSQKVASSTCLLSMGVDRNVASGSIAAAVDEFDRILKALRLGDPGLGIYSVETRARTLEGIKNAEAEWSQVKEAAVAVNSGNATDQDHRVVFDNNLVLLEAAQQLVTEISSQYSASIELVQADALLIEIAGRQRMLLQRISKSACLLNSEFESSTSLDELNSVIRMFESSLQALRDGLPAAGIRRPPNDGISDALAVVAENWMSATPTLERVVQGEKLPLEVVDGLTSTLAQTVQRMNDAVLLYARAAVDE